MGRIARGWRLAKLSLGVIRKDKELLVFPLLSALITILILISFVAGAFVAFGFEGMLDGSGSLTLGILMVAFYFIAFFISIFFNAAVVGAAMIRLEGGDPTFSDGIRIARENIKQILLWAIFAATVALVIRAIQKRVGFVGRIIMGALGVSFTIATYFVVPVFIYEKLGPWAALKRSVAILKGTWGEALIGNLGLGAIFFLLGLLGLIPLFAGFVIFTTWSIIIGVVVAIVYWLILGLVASAASAVLLTALYRYATTGKISEGFVGISFSNPWAR